MKFEPTEEQRAFSRTLEKLLDAADTPTVNRAWAAGDTAPGLALWERLAAQGVNALVVDEEYDGMGASAVELVLAMRQLGRYAVPGPWIESCAYLPRALDDAWLSELAAGALGTVAAPPHTPYACDGAQAHRVFAVRDGVLHDAAAGEAFTSVDGSRRLTAVTVGEPVGTGDTDAGFDLAALACAAQLAGAGERVLADAVEYVKQRRQFGREIGSYQAIKHRLADVRIALDFVDPLLYGAALAEGTATFSRDVSAAKAYAADAAYLASRVALQVHGAIGYTAEFDLSLLLTRIRALVTAWGTPAFHRERLLSLVAVD